MSDNSGVTSQCSKGDSIQFLMTDGDVVLDMKNVLMQLTDRSPAC